MNHLEILRRCLTGTETRRTNAAGEEHEDLPEVATLELFDAEINFSKQPAYGNNDIDRLL